MSNTYNKVLPYLFLSLGGLALLKNKTRSGSFNDSDSPYSNPKYSLNWDGGDMWWVTNLDGDIIYSLSVDEMSEFIGDNEQLDLYAFSHFLKENDVIPQNSILDLFSSTDRVKLLSMPHMGSHPLVSPTQQDIAEHQNIVSFEEHRERRIQNYADTGNEQMSPQGLLSKRQAQGARQMVRDSKAMIQAAIAGQIPMSDVLQLKNFDVDGKIYTATELANLAQFGTRRDGRSILNRYGKVFYNYLLTHPTH
jgi:hypothetical protein